MLALSSAVQRAARLPRGRTLTAAVGAAALAASLLWLVPAIDAGVLATTWRAALADPAGVALALAAYLLAFALRALLWSRALPGLPAGQALAGIHLALAGNHLLPLRLGEALRVTSVVRRTRLPVAPVAASTVTLRAADLATVLALAALLAPASLGRPGWVALAAVTVAGAATWWWLARQPHAGSRSRWRKRLLPARRAATGTVALGMSGQRLLPPIVVLGAAAAWLLESVLVWQAARWAGVELSAGEAVLVTVVSVAAQVVAVAPGGVGTYEAAAVAAYASLGVAAAPALAAALAAHALKTAYALLAGAVALLHPEPGMLGRLRLRLRLGRPARRTAAPVGAGPVVLFLPARDEVATVAAVLARAPAAVCGRPVERLVVDDGSADGTGEAAARAGATVERLDPGRGLGAGVRHGLAWAVGRGAAAVAFCDADGEYDPAELERLVAPILDGRADYVVGSRFGGDIGRMLPHRRLGNRLLTVALAVVARHRISDGQSGFRALSGEAAAAAEIVHDYNYAQVLTLDLLAKGFRYREAPISYSFRTHGRSFVRLGRYLRHVVPAVHRELGTP